MAHEARVQEGLKMERDQAMDLWKHFDSLVWTVTSILLAANIALLLWYLEKGGKSGWHLQLYSAAAGLVVTLLTVYFATSFRELRFRAENLMTVQMRAVIQGNTRRFRQWYVFLLVFLIFESSWGYLLLTAASEQADGWLWGSRLFLAAVVVATLWLGAVGRSPKEKAKRGQATG
jgi:hypothetical protein